jgi:acyl-CoA thioester hydrolase
LKLKTPANPDATHFSHQITVTEADIDLLNHANNLSYIRWVQDVAVAHSFKLGMQLSDYQAMGAVFIIKRHEIDYLRPALLGDVLRVDTWVPQARGASCERATEITRISDSVVVARAMTTWVFIDTVTGRPKKVPDDVRVMWGFSPKGHD